MSSKPRFRYPHTKQLFDIAVLFNEGVVDKDKLADMVGYAKFIIDRLHENGDITKPTIQEVKDRARFNGQNDWWIAAIDEESGNYFPKQIKKLQVEHARMVQINIFKTKDAAQIECDFLNSL